ncbi:MAG TPA: hypothetical protein VHV78_09425 [Gemmatimonadaceae bacterium]|jgi:hypothetical protein|nr:hypothetical protein [Gemmatimonadaceae bacterium]
MKPIKTAIIFALVLAPAIASAQGYYGGGYRNGFHHRRMGRLAFGFSVGLGGMWDGGGRIECDACNYNPLSFEVDGHVGGMLTSRFALLFEVQANVQTVSPNGGDTQTLSQGAAMVAGQYWLTPQLWIKGGIGFAHLELDYADQGPADPVDSGFAIMGAIGYEVFSAPYFAVDLQARLIEGSYDGIDDHITAGNVGLGFNWY